MKTKRSKPNKYSMARFREMGRQFLEMHQRERIESGQDPDEYTIWNVLCPKIREKWSVSEERSRRRIGHRVPAGTPLLHFADEQGMKWLTSI